MSERTSAGLEITDRRTSGVNFASALLRVNSDFVNVPAGDTELFFDHIDILRATSDKCHALAYGYDDDKQVLLRDGMPVFGVSRGDYLSIEAENEDLSRLIVSQNSRYGSTGLYLIDEKQQFALEDGASTNLVWHSDDFKNFWISRRVQTSAITHGTGFFHHRFDDLGNQTIGYFLVGRSFPKPDLIGVSDNSEELLWTAYKDDKKYVYKNEKRLYKASATTVVASRDLDRVVYAINSSDDHTQNPNTSVYIGHGKDKPKMIHRGKFRVSKYVANEDVTRVAFEIRNTDKKLKPVSLLSVVDNQFVLSEPFDNLAEFKVEDDGHIVARIVRDGVERIITVPARKDSGGRGEPPVMEEKSVA